MTETQFMLSWDSYRNNICSGLSALQQNGEFVDMTLAADGHHVKVHQLVMSLASPYIKDIVTSTHCTHPVVFLNQISYKTLCSLLEYIYTGEVKVMKEDIQDLLRVAKALHIRGLDDTNLSNLTVPDSCAQPSKVKSTPTSKLYSIPFKDNFKNDVSMPVFEASKDNAIEFVDTAVTDPKIDNRDDKTDGKPVSLQYTVSNQGNLMLILNRCVYRSRYVGRRGRFRRWQCTSYMGDRCPAVVVTTADDTVAKRFNAHNHPFHDRQILKKVQKGMVFNAIKIAEEESSKLKKPRAGQPIDTDAPSDDYT